MKKLIAIVALAAVVATSSFAEQKRGGLVGLIAGCCFGMRAAADYNSGKDLIMREWCRFIPIAGFIVAILDGIDGMNGVTRSDYQKDYGSSCF